MKTETPREIAERIILEYAPRYAGESQLVNAIESALKAERERAARMLNKESPTFEQGVVWACARIVELYDQPTIAADILSQSGIGSDSLAQCAEYDLEFLRREDPSIPRGEE